MSESKPREVPQVLSAADVVTDATRPGVSYRTPIMQADPTPVRSLLGQAVHDTFGQTGARLGLAWIAVIAVIGVFAPLIANSHPFVLKLKGGGISFPMIRHLTAVDVCLFMYFPYLIWALTRNMLAPSRLVLALWPLVGIAALLLALYGVWPALHLGKGFGQVLGNIVVAIASLGGIALAVFATVHFARAFGSRPALLSVAVSVAVLMGMAAISVRAPEGVTYSTYRQLERDGRVDWMLRTIIPYSPNDRLRDEGDVALNAPSRQHWFGTTTYSEDLLSRILHACRVALTIGIIATGISTLIGVIVGGAMGYLGGWVDLLGMRVLEIVQSIPTLILLLIVTVSFGRSIYLMMIVIGLISWVSDARLIRAEFLKLRTQDFVQAAVATGLRRGSIVFKHMLPNGIAPVLVNASFGIAGAILLESTLSFLGLGLGPDDPSWGQLLDQARAGSTGFVWWIATFPGLFIFLTVFAYVLIGESMRDALDPRLRKRD